MKVLVATRDGHGELPEDYCWTTDGELAHLLDCPDPLCGCSAFGGFGSLRAATTALVVERSDLDVPTFVAARKRRFAVEA